VKYRLIQENPEYPVAKWAGHLRIERTGYYAWMRRKDTCAEREGKLKKMIRKEFDLSRGTYGPDRISKRIRELGERIGYKKCATYMAELGLESSHNRHRSRSLTNSNSSKARGKGYPNMLRDKMFPIVPRMEVASDITYLKTDEGFMYHCVIRDIVTKEVLGDHMADRMTKELVVNAILAMTARNSFHDGCVFHSGRGSQYTSKMVMELLARLGFKQSSSRVGMPGDNSWSESFFATMKKELVRWTHFATKIEARAAVFDYIYGFYNVTRIQKGLGYKSPNAFLRSLQIKELEDVA
jgi:putative transposase